MKSQRPRPIAVPVSLIAAASITHAFAAPPATELSTDPIPGKDAVVQDTADVDIEEAEERVQGYLGIGLGAVADPLRDHLGIDPGVGVLVTHLDPKGPAQAAGVEPNDIVVGIDDQIVTSSQHLITLVQNKTPGSKIALEVYRKGARKDIEVSLGAAPKGVRKARQNATENRGAGLAQGPQPGLQMFFGTPDGIRAFGGQNAGRLPRLPNGGSLFSYSFDLDSMPEMDEVRKALEQQGIELNKLMSGNRGARGLGGGIHERFGSGIRNGGDAPSPQVPEALLPEGEGARVVSSSSRMIQISDGNHNIRLSGKDGDYTLLAKDAEGEVLYDGPYNSEAEKESVPAEVREKVDKAQGMVEKTPKFDPKTQQRRKEKVGTDA